MDKSRLHIVVPMLNEEGNVERLLTDLENLSHSIVSEFALNLIFVDDGSTDKTFSVLKNRTGTLNINILSHKVNLGPGAAFATAFKYLSLVLNENDWVITMEGDNTSRLDTLRQMLVRRKEGYDVVLASPYLYGGEMVNTDGLRVFLSHVANLFVKEFLGIRGILTMSSFFRLYSARIVKQLQIYYGNSIIERKGFECMIELLLKLIYLNARISELAMVLDTSKRMGKSKMKIARTIYGYLVLFKHRRKWFLASKKIIP